MQTKILRIQNLSVAHNFLTALSTENDQYVADSKKILDRLLQNARKISGTNTKVRTRYFSQVETTIQSYQEKLCIDPEMPVIV